VKQLPNPTRQSRETKGRTPCGYGATNTLSAFDHVGASLSIVPARIVPDAFTSTISAAILFYQADQGALWHDVKIRVHRHGGKVQL